MKIVKKYHSALFLLLFLTTCQPKSLTENTPEVWLHRANQIEKAQRFQYEYSGLEIDVHYIDSIHTFIIKHNENENSNLTLDQWCTALDNISNLGIWFDFKNLTTNNREASLQSLMAIREKHHLKGKLVVESSNFNELTSFNEAGFLTSFYIPYFNPTIVDSLHYQLFREKTQAAIDNHITYISGYDFQYEFMKQEFPDQPKLVWTINLDKRYQAKWKKEMTHEKNVEIILVPNEDW